MPRISKRFAFVAGSFVAVLLAAFASHAADNYPAKPVRVLAGGTIATRIAAQGVPDGYTLLCNSSQYAAAASLYKDPGYDPFRDFAPIINAGVSPNMIFVHPGVTANNLQELIALGRKQKLQYGSAGAGSTPKAVVAKLSADIANVIAMPEVKERLAVLGFDPVSNNADQFTAYIREEVTKWAQVIKDSGAKVE